MLEENQLAMIKRVLINETPNDEDFVNVLASTWEQYPVGLLMASSMLWDDLPASKANLLIDLFIAKGHEISSELIAHFPQLAPKLRVRLLPLVIPLATDELKALMYELANSSKADAERCSYLGALTILGEQKAAESLLEMEAILGELTSLGKDLGQILLHYLLEQGEGLVNTLLVEGNVNKVRALVKHLQRIKNSLNSAKEQQRKKGEKLLAALGRLAAEFLQSGNNKQRRAAIEILATSPVIIPLWLTKAFRDEQVYLRAMVMRIVNKHLDEYGYGSFPGASPEVIAKLVLKGLQDPSPLVREKAVLCLKNTAFPNKLAYLMTIAKSEYEVIKVRLAAINTLTELLPSDKLDDLLFELRNDRRFPIRFFVRELQYEIKNSEGLEDFSLLWDKGYDSLGSGYHSKVERLLTRWLEKLELPEAQRNEQALLTELAEEALTEHGLRQILDFYQEWEDRFLALGDYRDGAEKLALIKPILRIFKAESIPILTHILAVEKDLHLRLAAIEALSEMALEGIEVEHIQTILFNHLLATSNPPDQEKILSILYVFPRETYVGLVIPFLSSNSANVAVRAASVLSSYDLEQVSCFNAKRIIGQIFRNVGERKVFGKYWADLVVYAAHINVQEKCGDSVLDKYLQADDYIVKRFAKEVRHHILQLHSTG